MQYYFLIGFKIDDKISPFSSIDFTPENNVPN